MKKILISMIMLVSFSAYAGSGDFMDRCSGRAMGSGNIFYPAADDSSAIFYNPACLYEIKEPVFTFLYTDFYSLGRIEDFIFSAGTKYKDKINFGAAWVFERIDLEPEIWGQHRFMLASSFPLSRYFYAGLNPKIIYISAELQGMQKVWGYGLDAGILLPSEPWDIGFLNNNELFLSVGLYGRDIYSDIKWADTSERKIFDALHWDFLLDIKSMAHILFQVQSMKTVFSGWAAGLEFSLFNTMNIHWEEKISDIVLRAGIQGNTMLYSQDFYTAGLSVLVKKYSFDYARLYQSGFSATHYISLSARDD